MRVLPCVGKRLARSISSVLYRDNIDLLVLRRKGEREGGEGGEREREREREREAGRQTHRHTDTQRDRKRFSEKRRR